MMKKLILITVEILRATVCAGKDLVAGKTYELKESDAILLIRLGKAKKIEDAVNLGIDEDTTKSLEEMTVKELLDYAAQNEIDIPQGAKKAEIIAILNSEDEE